MPEICEDEVRCALGKVGDGLEKYRRIQARFKKCDVTLNRDFQREFNGFYRVRRNEAWRTEYFKLLEGSKDRALNFEEVLRALHEKTDRIEVSFASKLVATINPDKPVIDRFVLTNFGMKLPAYGTPNRLEKSLQVYEKLCSAYQGFITSPTGSMILQMFDQDFDSTGITTIKKIDLVLWQIRA